MVGRRRVIVHAMSVLSSSKDERVAVCRPEGGVPKGDFILKHLGIRAVTCEACKTIVDTPRIMLSGGYRSGRPRR